jgi:hypothetical protein
MRTTRRWTALALVAGWVGAAVLMMAAPASADVDCVDLGSQAAAQTYYDGHAGDPDGLDADHDGTACEASAPHTGGTWTLILLGVLFVGGLARYTTLDKDRDVQGAEASEPLDASVPAPPRLVLVEQVAGGGVSSMLHREAVVNVALTGSVSELARALRMVQYSERMGLLEAHAAAHDTSPKDVLAALAESTSDLELQGWALSGYDPPWTVRVMRCSCVDGLRNFQLTTADDGSHFWACASCHQPVRTAT